MLKAAHHALGYWSRQQKLCCYSMNLCSPSSSVGTPRDVCCGHVVSMRKDQVGCIYLRDDFDLPPLSNGIVIH